VLAERALGHEGGDVGIAVPVTADPAPEAEEGPYGEGAPRILAREGPPQSPHERGGEVEERALEVVEAVDDLVDHARPVAARLLGLPERDHLLANELERRLRLLGGGRAEVERAQGVRDPGELGENRPALGFGGVGGEDGHDEQPRDEGLHLGSTDPFLAQPPHRGRDRLPHRLAALLGLARAPAQDADALLLLREIHELEVGGEGLDDAAGLRQRQRLDAGEQVRARGRVPRAVRLGEVPHFLHALEEAPPLLLDEGLAQQIPELVDLLAEEVAHIAFSSASS
jgi:hypothetical protein